MNLSYAKLSNDRLLNIWRHYIGTRIDSGLLVYNNDDENHTRKYNDFEVSAAHEKLCFFVWQFHFT